MRVSNSCVRENLKFSATLGFASLMVQVAALASEVVETFALRSGANSSLFALRGMLLLLSSIVIARSSPGLRKTLAPVKWIAALAMFPFVFTLRDQVSPLVSGALPTLGATLLLQRSGLRGFAEIACLSILALFVPTVIGYSCGTVGEFPTPFREVCCSTAVSISLLALALSFSEGGWYVTRFLRAMRLPHTIARQEI